MSDRLLDTCSPELRAQMYYFHGGNQTTNDYPEGSAEFKRYEAEMERIAMWEDHKKHVEELNKIRKTL